jgi:hypothetical protein
MLASKTFIARLSWWLRSFFYSETMKRFYYIHMAMVMMLVLAGFSTAHGSCGVADGPAAYSQRSYDTVCCVMRTSAPAGSGCDDGAGSPVSNESSCDFCQLCPDAALSSLSTEFSPAGLFGAYPPTGKRPLLAGHVYPLIDPPQL